MHKVYVTKRKDMGRGLFALRDIKKGELVLVFSGKKWYAKDIKGLPKNIGDYAIQISPRIHIDSKKSIGRYANHSCNPNSGIRGMRKLIAVKNITAGDEIVWDYSASDDSGWYHKCSCGAKNCRKIITPWRDLPASTKRKYTKLGIVSSWITKRDRSPNKH